MSSNKPTIAPSPFGAVAIFKSYRLLKTNIVGHECSSLSHNVANVLGVYSTLCSLCYGLHHLTNPMHLSLAPRPNQIAQHSLMGSYAASVDRSHPNSQSMQG